MKTRIVFLSILVTAILGACAKSNGGSADTTNGASSVNDVQGNWQGSCTPYGGGTTLFSSLSTASFTGPNLSINGSSFSTQDCSGSITSVLKAKFTYDIPSHSSVDPSILNFNATLVGIFEVFLDQDAANAANTMSACGFTNWVVGIEKDVTGLSCISGMPGTPGKVVYSILKISNQQIQLGEADSSHDGSTPDLRHVALSASSFKKIQ